MIWDLEDEGDFEFSGQVALVCWVHRFVRLGGQQRFTGWRESWLSEYSIWKTNLSRRVKSDCFWRGIRQN